MRILYIEDNPDVSGPVSRLFRRHSHKVVVAAGDIDALSQINVLNSFDIVVLDIMMMNESDLLELNENEDTGIALLRKIRDTNKDIPVLILTALSKDQLKEEMGVNNSFQSITYFQKPVTSGNNTNLLHMLEGDFEDEIF